ncbi:MAG TPA: leucine-rich repeat domain-containing protein [Bacteroidales bacterium]|nr:leucine-rich repeat domain-containing protein [Bacteroidales bacterium]
MTVRELHNELIEAYSVDNLNTISLVLINLFKEKNYPVLQKISDLIREYTDIRIADNGKGFSTLMMLYHPDRAVYHIDQINKLAAENNLAGLMKYSHILKLDRIGEIASSAAYEDIDYSPVYDWDMSEFFEEGYRIFDADEREEKITAEYLKKSGCTFYDALKIREFGDADANYPLYYLEEMEDFQMSSFGINDLDGIQLCTRARILNLSNNKISDLVPLTGLDYVEKLDLSDNEIGFIDSIGTLKTLRSVHLNNNYIEDISPLYGLYNLEYVSLAGNNIDTDQINHLGELGIIVDY